MPVIARRHPVLARTSTVLCAWGAAAVLFAVFLGGTTYIGEAVVVAAWLVFVTADVLIALGQGRYRSSWLASAVLITLPLAYAFTLMLLLRGGFAVD